MKNTVKREGRIALCLLLCLALTGCGADTAAPAQTDEPQIVLDVWHQWVDQNEVLEKAVISAAAQYEAEHPNISIELHGLNGETYKEKISMDFAGAADDIDVFYYWAPSRLKVLVDAGRVLPLNDRLTDEVMDRLRDGSTDSLTIDGKIYGLPTGSSMMAVFCNTALFEKAGAELPTTYSELLEAGEKLSAIGVTPLAVGAQTPWLAGLLYEMLALRQVGAQTVKAALDGEVSMADTPGFRTAAEQMHELYAGGVLGPNPLNVSDSDAVAAFLNGEAAMLLDGSWAASNIDDSDLDAGDVAVIAFPLADDGRYAGDYMGATGGGSFFVNSGTDHPDESADFAIYIAEYLGTHIYELGTGLSCWETDVSDVSPTLKKLLPLFATVTDNVPSWNTVLSASAAGIHLTGCQALLTPDPDIDAFLAEHDAAIAKQNE